jgi:hypothetical protein
MLTALARRRRAASTSGIRCVEGAGTIAAAGVTLVND